MTSPLARSRHRQAVGYENQAAPERRDAELLIPPDRPPIEPATLHAIIRRLLLCSSRRERLIVAALDWRGLPPERAAELAELPIGRVREILAGIQSRERRAMRRIAGERRLRRIIDGQGQG